MIRRALHAALFIVAAAASPAAVRWNAILQQPAEWYASAEARAVADSVLLYQTDSGGWPKNTDMTLPPSASFLAETAFDHRAATIDNSATTTQLQFLGRVLAARPDVRYRAAFERGVDYLLAAQYPNGGWPQYYPLREGYYTHITFNDDAMVRVLRLLREAAAGLGGLDDARRQRAAAAVERGIACILKCQVRVDGKLTAWCAQHDETTFAPAAARKYEHASLSGFESVSLVRFLMSIEKPSPEIVAAVQSAVAWFEQAKLTGIRIDHPPAPELPHRHDRVVVADPSAPPIWARFYEIGTNRPIFGGRDGVIRYALAEIEPERRGGYRWYGDEPAALLEKDYPRWRAKNKLP